MKTTLLIKNLNKSFHVDKGEEYHVLKGIDLEMRETEFFALMGPSGSGKSTLLNIIGGLIPASSGSVNIDESELADLTDNELTEIRRNKVGWCFQDFNLIDNLSALENVVLAMNLAGKRGSDVEQRGKELLEAVGLGDRIHHLPDALSGGQQQRVAIARSLANNPTIILADEPTGNLDSQTGKEIIDLFKQLANSGKTILMVSHDIALAHAAQKVFILRNGRVEEETDANKEEL
ncbi:MAG: ABC transporter ATP-binding protein [Candidatus Heimdallarchaeota archaeon]|nr:ABC transporter ATP-binding protein [Candidatus Heimdallarchaeota archaeon]MDH5644750.1 ABC transporter ATP-binding protein [Candidatus Heimdallarchaeota archaeon]